MSDALTEAARILARAQITLAKARGITLLPASDADMQFDPIDARMQKFMQGPRLIRTDRRAV